MASEKAHAVILQRVAVKTIAEAREAWRRARTSTDEHVLRAAFRACVLAARVSRKAQLTSEASKLDTAADELKARLVRACVPSACPRYV